MQRDHVLDLAAPDQGRRVDDGTAFDAFLALTKIVASETEQHNRR